MLAGVGEDAYAQYTWVLKEGRRYSYAEAAALAGDTTVEVMFEASQERKDVDTIDSSTDQSVTEENAIREVSGLITAAVKGVTRWRSAPGEVAQADATSTTSPSAAASATPTLVADLPPVCQEVSASAMALVPGAKPRAESADNPGHRLTDCFWANGDIPDGAGMKEMRSVSVSVYAFANRAGAEDPAGADAFYGEKLGESKAASESTMEGVETGKLELLEGLGDSADYAYTAVRAGEFHVGNGTLTIKDGAGVLIVRFAGSRLPVGAAANGPDVALMARKETRDGGRAFLATD